MVINIHITDDNVPTDINMILECLCIFATTVLQPQFALICFTFSINLDAREIVPKE